MRWDLAYPFYYEVAAFYDYEEDIAKLPCNSRGFELLFPDDSSVSN